MRTGHVALAIATLMTTTTLPAIAEDSGHWHGLGVLTVANETTIKVEDRANHVVRVLDEDGAIYNADGAPFLNKARYQVAAIIDSGVTGNGYKTFTDADGSKAFAKFTVTESKPPELKGTFQFTGGTGKYTGITGNGTFNLVRLSDKVAWDELVGDYKIPTAVAGTANKN